MDGTPNATDAFTWPTAVTQAFTSSSPSPAEVLLPSASYDGIPISGTSLSLDLLLGGLLRIEGNGSAVANDSFANELLDPCDPSNAEFACSVQQFLEYARGPQQMPLLTALLVTILLTGILVTGVIGNLIVCLVIVRHPSMRTATNYYLFSLAVSDLIFLVLGLPYEISLYWHQYPYDLGLPFCKIRALLSEASTYVSVLTIVAFSMERFLAICHPLHLYTMSGLQRPVRIIAGLWIVSLLSAVPFAVFTDIDYLVYPPTNKKIHDSAFCAMLSNPEGFPLWELSTCLFFAFPMLIMVVLYARMGMQIRSRTQRTVELGVRNGSVNGPSRVSQSRKAIIRMLAAVVITFFVCWAPFHAQRLLYLYARDWQHFNMVNTWLFSVAGCLYYVSCTINPILYNVMSHRYRVAFRETLCGRRRGFGAGFTRDQSSFRETTIDVGGNGSFCGYDHSRPMRARSMMQSKRSRYRCNLQASNSIRRNSLQIGNNHPNNRNSLSPNLTTDIIVMLENNLNGRPRCYTTSASTLVTTVVSSTSTVADASSLRAPLISIDKPNSDTDRTLQPPAGHNGNGSCNNVNDNTHQYHANSNNNSNVCNNRNYGDDQYSADHSLLPPDDEAQELVNGSATPLLPLPTITVDLEDESLRGQEPRRNSGSSNDRIEVERRNTQQLPEHPRSSLRCGGADDGTTSLLPDAKRETCI